LYIYEFAVLSVSGEVDQIGLYFGLAQTFRRHQDFE